MNSAVSLNEHFQDKFWIYTLYKSIYTCNTYHSKENKVKFQNIKYKSNTRSLF